MTRARFEEDKKFIWLASYPKSGNTWLRSLLTAYLFPDDDFDLNALVGEQDPFDRQILDDHAGLHSADFLPEELIEYQAQLHRNLARQSPYWRLVKTHSAYIRSSSGTALFPASASAGAIIVVRNPMDIVPSYAHHQGRDYDWAIAHMADETAGAHAGEAQATTRIPQRMSSWSANVSSWLLQDAIPVHLLRYEDIHADPETCLSAVLRFCAIEIDDSLVSAAVKRCGIDQLRKDEATKGFSERPSVQRTFFRSGKTGDGRRELTDKQKNAILRYQAKTMLLLGYSTELSDYATAETRN